MFDKKAGEGALVHPMWNDGCQTRTRNAAADPPAPRCPRRIVPNSVGVTGFEGGWAVHVIGYIALTFGQETVAVAHRKSFRE